MAAVLASKLVINSLTPKYFGICRTVRSVEWRLSQFTCSKHWIHRHFPCLGVKGQQIKMPSLSPTMTEGTIIKWTKTEGDSVMAGDLICEIQTDKAVVGYEVDEDGILAKILVPADTKDIKVGTCIALMVGEGEDWKDVEIHDAGTQDTSSTSETTTPVKQTEPESTRKPETSQRVSKFSMVGPAVRGLLELYGLESSQIPPSGPHNNLIKGDVLEYIKKQNLKPKAPKETSSIVKGTLPPKKIMVPSSGREEEYVDIPLTDSKSTIANALVWSKKTIPHSYMNIDCYVGKLNEICKKFKDEGVEVTVNECIIKAVAATIQSVPEVNVTWTGESVQVLPSINISFNVSTAFGMVTPTLRNVGSMGIVDISDIVKELSDKAHKGTLKPHDTVDGSFSISSVDVDGIRELTDIVNTYQAAILGIGSTQLSLGEDGRPEATITISLSYDVRAIDDEVAARFLKLLRQNLENPILILASPPSNERSASVL